MWVRCQLEKDSVETENMRLIIYGDDKRDGEYKEILKVGEWFKKDENEHKPIHYAGYLWFIDTINEVIYQPNQHVKI